MRPRILLAEDHPEIAEQLCALLQTEFDVIGIAKDGNALVSSAETLQPDVIVTDIAMPNVDGIAAVQRIVKQNPKSRIIFVTVHSDPLLKRKAFESGGLAYILKTAAGEELIQAIHSALRVNR
jgi:DNA-binding NarL/FixJ family response regulator